MNIDRLQAMSLALKTAADHQLEAIARGAVDDGVPVQELTIWARTFDTARAIVRVKPGCEKVIIGVVASDPAEALAFFQSVASK